jgi:hypothetical protein
MPVLVSDCNAIVIVPIGVSGYQKGQVIEAELLYGLNGVPDKKNNFLEEK